MTDRLDFEEGILEYLNYQKEYLISLNDFIKECEELNATEQLIRALKNKIESQEKIILWQEKLYQNHITMLQC